MNNNKNKNTEIIAMDKMTPELFKKIYGKEGFVVVGIPREHVEKKKMEYIYSFADTFMKCKEAKNRGVLLSFDGYNDDPRELYMIPEFKKYIEDLFNYCPSILAFLYPESKKILIITLSFTIAENKGETHKVMINYNKFKDVLIKASNHMVNTKVFTINEAEEFLKSSVAEMGA